MINAARGSVLILAIWAVSFLSIVTMALTSRATSLIRLHSRVMEQLQSSAALNAAVEHAIWSVAQDETSGFDGLYESWSGEGRFRLAPSAEAHGTAQASLEVSWKLEGENARLPLNTAPPDILMNLILEVTDAGRDRAAVIAESIADWRDEDSEARPNGAESYYYLGQRPSYECADAPFRNNEELLLVRGMTPALYAQLEPYVTAYSDGTLNLNTADEKIITALGLSSAGADGLLFFLAGEDAIRGTPDDRLFISTQGIVGDLEVYLPQEDIQRLSRIQRDLLGVRDSHFRLRAEARNAHDYGRKALTAVIDREGKRYLWIEE